MVHKITINIQVDEKSKTPDELFNMLMKWLEITKKNKEVVHFTIRSEINELARWGFGS